MSLVNALGAIALDQTVQDVVDKLDAGVDVVPANITTKFREPFEPFTPGVNWNLTTGSGDIVQLDGNAVSASYLVISKDPLQADTQTILETVASFDAPIELSVGLHTSNRVAGVEFSMELVSTEESLPSPADIAIGSISQTTTTLSVNTVTPHGLSAGQRIGIRGVSDSRFNYPQLVVATIGHANQFAVTAGPTGTLPSQTITGPNNSGFVYTRSAMGGARNGMSQVFESTTSTGASLYVRSASGDALPSGTASGNHVVGSANTTSSAAIGSANVYSFRSASEFRMNLQADRATWYDVAIDSTGAPTTRLLRTEVIPDVTKQYKLRFRAVSQPSMTVPVAQIVSVSKTGTTTATITTNVPHGLTTSDFVVAIGTRDTTNFPVTVGATGVTAVVSATEFRITWGSATTATSYGGFVARSNGGVGVPGLIGMIAQSIERVTTPAVLQMTLNATGSGLAIGDYVNLVGIRDNVTGASLGLDGTYRCTDTFGTTYRFAPIGSTTLPGTLAVTNCGGAIIKRTDLRLSFARIFDYVRERVELLTRSDAAGAVGVNVVGGTVGVTGSVATQVIPNQISTDIASAALTSTATSASITPSNNSGSCEFNVIVTAASGTNPTLDVVVQESDDTGTNWFDVYHFPRITAVGQYRSPLIPLTGNRYRYVRTVTGTSPSFTHAVNRLQSNTPQSLQRQFSDRTIAPNTLNSVTPSFFTEGCVDLNVFVCMGAVTTTPPVLAFEISYDNVNWWQVGADITTAASTNTLLQLSNAQGRFARVRVKTAGSGATLNYVVVKGVGK
jgi:hypothetical protein